MYTVGRIGSYISRGVYTVSGPFHPFGGAVDIIVVQQPDGSFRSSPWYVRFGKFQGVLQTREKVVSISVNGSDAGFHMYLDHKGEAYFLREVDGGGEDGESNLYPSSSGDESPDEKSQSAEKRRLMKSESSNFDAKVSGSVDLGEGKIVARTNSRRSRIFGLVFGRRSMKEEIFQAEEEGLGPSVGSVDSLERAEFAADLLEVKWSTSLATRKYRKGNNSWLSNRGESMQTDSSNVSCSQKMGEGIESQAQKDVESPVEDAVAELSNSKEGVLGIKETSEFTSETVMYYDDYRIDHVGGEVNEKVVNVVSEIAADYNKEFGDAYIEDTTIDLPRRQSWEESLVQRVQSQELGESLRSMHSGLSVSAEEYHETVGLATEGDAGEAMEGGAMEVHAETMLVQTEAVLKDPAVIESERSYKVSPEVILLNPSEDGPNEVCDDWITGDGSRGELQLKLKSIGNKDNSFSDGDFLTRASSPSSESSEEVQFQFSDLDDPRLRKNSTVNRHLQDPVNDEEENACLENSTQQRGTVDFDDATNKVASSPINIARISHALADEEVGRLAESMPTMRSHIENIDSYSLHFPLSQSMDIDPKPLNLLIPCKVVQNLPEPEELLQQDQINSSRNDQILQDDGNAPLSPEVEFMKLQAWPQDWHGVAISASSGGKEMKRSFTQEEKCEEELLSLCGHMLYEGMEAEAAAQAFESEKLNRDRFMSLCPMVMKDDRLVVRIGGRYFPWEAAAPIVLGLVSFGSKLVTEPKGMIVVEKKAERMLEETSRAMSPSSVSWRLWPLSFKRSPSGKVMQDIGTEPSADEKERSLDIFEYSDKAALKPKLVKKMVRSITPTSEQLASLNLKEGSNPVTFTFSTAMLGKQRVDARIYLWKWNTRIIISDVDGTITKSDVLGQFMPLVGMDWSQTGVARLFSAIKENGYQLLFLSARAISQAYHTRQFLFNLKQDGKGLPDGPVVISPDGLFPSLYREVIRRAPHEFKIGCLEKIKALFPPDCNPFYAGFGNRDTDEISYLKVGIPKGKIFTINPRGEVAVNRHINTKSYTSLHTLVHGMFPSTAKSEQEDFNSWNYWKLPPPNIDI